MEAEDAAKQRDCQREQQRCGGSEKCSDTTCDDGERRPVGEQSDSEQCCDTGPRSLEQYGETDCCHSEQCNDNEQSCGALHCDPERHCDQDSLWCCDEEDSDPEHRSSEKVYDSDHYDPGQGYDIGHNDPEQCCDTERYVQGLHLEMERHNPEQCHNTGLYHDSVESCDTQQKPYREIGCDPEQPCDKPAGTMDLPGDDFVGELREDDNKAEDCLNCAERDDSNDAKSMGRGADSGTDSDDYKVINGENTEDKFVKKEGGGIFAVSVGAHNRESVSGWEDETDKLNGCRLPEMELAINGEKYTRTMGCQPLKNRSKNQDMRMDSSDDDAFLDETISNISQTSDELSSDQQQKSNNSFSSLAEIHNSDVTSGTCGCKSSQTAGQHYHTIDTFCDSCDKRQISCQKCERLSNVSSNNLDRVTVVDNQPECKPSAIKIMSNSDRVGETLEQDATEDPYIENRVCDKGEHTDTDNQSNNAKSQFVSVCENREDLQDKEKTEDLSSSGQLGSSAETDDSPVKKKKKAQSRNKWTKFIACPFLTRNPHKSENNPQKDSSSTQRTISDKLPEVPPKGILHIDCHEHSSTVRKELTFELPDPKEEGHQHQEDRATITEHAIQQNPSSRNDSLTNSSKQLPLLSLSKMMHKQSQDRSRDVGHASEAASSSTEQNSTGTNQVESRKNLKMPRNAQTNGKSNCCLPLLEKCQKCWQSDSSIEGKEIRNTLVVGVAFQLVFTAHFAIQNLQSSLHEEEYLGVSALGCLYGASIFSSIFSPTIIGLLGLKGCLVVAWLSHMLYTLAQFYPSWQTLVPASVCLGALSGPTWTAQGVYVSACAFSFSRRSPHSPYTILSRFNGLFFTLYETRQILGNLLSSIVLRHGVGNRSQEVVFRYCGPRDCPSAENVTDIEEPDGLVIHVMLGIYLVLQVVALVLTIVLLTPLSRSEWWSRAPIRETAASWFKTLVGTRMLFLVPFMIFQAMEQGMLLSEYTKSYISCPIGIHMVGFVMATHGAASALFVFVFSRLARRTGRYPLFALAAVLSLALLIALYDWTPGTDQTSLIFLCPVLWGVGEGIWQTQTNSMIAVVFWNRKESAFANYQTWRALGYTFIFSFHSLLCVNVKIAITIGFLVVGMVLYTAVEVRSYRRERQRFMPKTDEATPADDPGTSTAGPSAGDAEDPSNRCSERADIELTITPPATGVGTDFSAAYPSFTIEDDSDRESECQLTLDGTYLLRGESAFLDNDLQKYGVVSAGGGVHFPEGRQPDTYSEERERWAAQDDDSGWNSGSGSSANQLPVTWHDVLFEDEGVLRVLRTKDDVFVY